MKIKNQLLIVIIYLTCFFYGCKTVEQLRDIIFVNVVVQGSITLLNSDGDEIDFSGLFVNPSVEIAVGKAGNTGDIYLLEIDEDGDFLTQQTLWWFEIYREQGIKAVAYMLSVPDEYTQIYGIDKLTWAELFSKVDFGDEYTWEAELNPILQLKE